jgi:hypothetical protein
MAPGSVVLITRTASRRQLRQMIIRIHGNPSPALVIDLRDSLREADCIAVSVDPDLLLAVLPSAPSEEFQRRIVGSYLRVWSAMHGVQAEIIE